MSSKRKFVIPTNDDEEENNTSAENIGGQSAFKKYKETLKKGGGNYDNNINNDQKKTLAGQSSSKTVAGISAPKPYQSSKTKTLNATDSTSSEIATLPTNLKRTDATIASEIAIIPNQQPSSSADTTSNATRTNATNTSTFVANPAQSTNRTVGKTFGETFAYLKNTDLYVLPPLPQPANKPKPENSNSIIVNSRQRGNPILKHVRNLPWEYGEIIPDYEIGQKICALFLSMRYHTLNPDYVHERLKKLGNLYEIRLLLVQVDVVNCKPSLKDLGRIAMLADCTLILAWSSEEAGRYLETYKQYENKPPDVLQQRVDTDHLSRMQDLLTTIKSINKTDVITLMSTFGSLKNIVNASKQEICDCPGIGSLKASRLQKAFNEPFRRLHDMKGYLRETTGEACKTELNDNPDSGIENLQIGKDIQSVSNLKLPCEVLSSQKLCVTTIEEEKTNTS